MYCIMIDVCSSRRKTISAPDFNFDSTLTHVFDLSCLPQEDEESLALIAPMMEDGSFHSDVASADSQPNLLQRVSQLPRHFAPRGLSDEDIINSCGSRSLHDIADIDNVSKNAVESLIADIDSAAASATPPPSPASADSAAGVNDGSSVS